MKKNASEKIEITAGCDKRGFTLVELLIVIVIIGILASVGIVSYKGTQAVARDSQRKNDLEAIGTAYKMHYQDKKVWRFAKSELTSLFPLMNAGYEGGGGDGQVWFNYAAPPYVSMADALVKTGYLARSSKDPLVLSNELGVKTSTTPPHQYMKYLCYNKTTHVLQGIVLLAQLEKPVTPKVNNYSGDSDSEAYDCYDSTGTIRWMTRTQGNYGMNYAIVVK